ncbi:MAG: 39S ribosomal protein L45 [Burkholderiales bacterium]|nr:39S ribosomal protein L45 [Burkholderiales bacterium]
MKNFLIVVILAFCATLLSVGDADAKKRLGGAKSTGMQKDNIQKEAPKPPAQNTVAPAGAAAPAAAAPSGMSRWLGPLAGLAAGGLLASMFMGGGFSGLKMMDILLFAGLAIGAFMLFRMYMRKKALENGSGSGSGNAAPMQYAGLGSAPGASIPAAAPTPFQSGGLASGAPEIGSKLMGGANAAPAAAPRIPADFDVPGFERQARFAFIRMQAANDARDVNDIRDFTTPEMYAELSLQIQERGDAPQKTEIVSLNVAVLEVTTEGQRAVASVRYTGEIREEIGGPAEAFDEIWHVSKRLDDTKSTWLLAGIQQSS